MRRGQSLIEIVIALGLFALTTTAALGLVINQFTLIHEEQDALRATLRATEGLDAARSIRDRDWFALGSGDHGLALQGDAWNFTGTSDTSDNLTRTVTVTDIDATTRDVTATVTWSPAVGRTREISYNTRLRDWRAIGAPQVSGDWRNPVTLGSVDLGPGVQANGIAVRNRIVFIAASASSSAKHDFFVVDGSDDAQPRIVGSIHTTPDGLNEVAASGSYAYVANREDDQNQLQIIDIANLAQPQLVRSFTPPGTGDDAEGWSIAVNGTMVYLGLDKNSGAEFHVIDVTNPMSPTARGSFEVGGDVYDITVKGNYAYLATDRDDQELVILDIANPAAPALVGRFDALGGSEEATGIDVHTDTGFSYLVRTVGGNHTNHHEFHIVNTSNPASPTNAGSLDIPHTVNAVATIDYLSFLATSDSNNEFKIYRTDNPAAIELWSSFNFPQVATDIAFERNIVYVSVRSNDALRIITSR